MRLHKINLFQKVSTTPLSGGATRERYVGTDKERGGKYRFIRTVGSQGRTSWAVVSPSGQKMPLLKNEAAHLEAQVS